MKTILIIEDEPQVRANIQQILMLGDFHPLSASNGVTGIRLAKENIPDLIVCDVMMPQLDGYGVLNELREDPETRDIPFIFLTAKVERSDLRQAMKLGADDYLTKPFTPEELLDAINVRLEKRNNIAEKYEAQIEKAKEKIIYLTYHDSLTKLPNQLLLKEQFYHLMTTADDQGLSVPLLVLGFDKFNQINSTFGHVAGNSLIVQIAQRLVDYFSTVESGKKLSIIANLGQDRFVLLAKPTEDKDIGITFAQECLKILESSFNVNNHEVFMKPSVGISYYHKGSNSLDQLLACAEVAMEKAQQQGGNHYEIYSEQIQFYSPRRLVLESSLHYALERNEFQVYYQPQIDLGNNKIVGVEALVYWNHPTLGLISPGEFIVIAEVAGLVGAIDQWVFREACDQLNRWKKMNFYPLKVSVNVSPYHLYQPNFVENVKNVLIEKQIDQELIELEITETMLMEDVEKAKKILDQIKELGIKIAIDDFGVGYSSLSYLKNFPFDTLKIDQSFVRDINDNSSNIKIIKAIISIAKAFNLNLIAEGIENKKELAFLQQEKCRIGQGFLFSKPLTTNEFNALYNFASSISMSTTYGFKSFNDIESVESNF